MPESFVSGTHCMKSVADRAGVRSRRMSRAAASEWSRAQ